MYAKYVIFFVFYCKKMQSPKPNIREMVKYYMLPPQGGIAYNH